MCAAPAFARPAIGLNPAGTQILMYDTAAPGVILERHDIAGLQPGESIKGIDVRPATGQLYALGIVRAANDTARLYVIDAGTGAAALVGSGPFKADFAVSEYGFDVSPAGDVVRVINTAEQNVRVNPTTGVATNDANLDSAGNIDAIAYDQTVAGAPNTTLWAYDSGSRRIERVGGVDGGPGEGSPNQGHVSLPYGNTSGVTTTGRAEMDFGPGASALLTASTAGPVYSLYNVNLAAGTIALIGNFPEPVEDLALLPDSSFHVDGSSQTVPEDGGTVSIQVVRTGNTSFTQSVNYSTADGTATAGSDYTATSGTLTFAPGEAAKSFTVPITDDAADEPAEKFTVSLAEATAGATAGSGTEVTIADNDVTPPAPVPDTTKPVLLLSAPTTLKLKKALGGVSGRLSCSEGCVTTLTLKLGKTKVGSAAATLPAAGVATFKAKLSSKGKKALRKALKKHRSATLSLGASGSDAAGNVGKTSARVKVTR